MTVFINSINSIRALHDHVLVTDMCFGERQTLTGVIIPADDKKDSGIRPRWARVFAIGPDQHDVCVGDHVLVSHGRWTRGHAIETETGTEIVRRVDAKDILCVSDQMPNDSTVADLK